MVGVTLRAWHIEGRFVRRIERGASVHARDKVGVGQEGAAECDQVTVFVDQGLLGTCMVKAITMRLLRCRERAENVSNSIGCAPGGLNESALQS
jgi:hypothetical protein